MKKLPTKALLAIVAVIACAFIATGMVAAKSQGGTRPGWGFGDKNHVHTGPPGQSVSVRPGNDDDQGEDNDDQGQGHNQGHDDQGDHGHHGENENDD